MAKRVAFWLFMLLIPVLNLHGQYFNNGQDRAAIKWKHIRSLHFEVIFPEGFEEQGLHVLHLMEKAYGYVPATLQHEPRRISVILHNETVKSNAFLGWAPGRIEMYTTPHQGIYSQDWLEQLALHEYRHMVQLSKLESEMPRVLRFIFGEQAAALLTAAYLPFWFLEGDAVSTETALSASGRGRQPEFFREMRAQLVEKGAYSYDKAYLGSYKDYVADYYHLGYLMVGGARKKFNKVVWDSVLHHVARKPFSLVAFDQGLKKTIGLNKLSLYDTIVSYFRTDWLAVDKTIKPTPAVRISPECKGYTNYRHVAFLENGNIFAQKTSLSDINCFIAIDEFGKEKKIIPSGYPFNESVSVSGNTVTWSERLPGVRWAHADKSLVRLLDTETNERKGFTFSSKMFAPVLSPDKTHIAVVESDRFYRFYITILSAKTGEIENQVEMPGNGYPITPSWNDNGTDLYAVLMSNNMKGIIKIDKAGERIDTLFPFGSYEIKHPKFKNDYLFFIGGFTGTDHVYAFKPETNELFEVVTSRFGISHYDIGENSIVYSDYSANGYRALKSDLNDSLFKRVDINTIQKVYPVAETLAKQEKGIVDFSKYDSISYEVEDYHKALNLFNFHSWAPLSIDPYNYKVYPGISVMSQNMLGTAEAILGYRYKWEEEKGEFYANYKFMGWYPVIESELNFGKSKSTYLSITQYVNDKNEVVKTDTVSNNFSWDETNLSINAHVPLNFSSGTFFRGIYPLVNYQLTNISGSTNEPKGFPKGIYHFMEAGIQAYTIMQASSQDVLPNFGLIVDARYNFSLPGVAQFGDMYTFSGTVYLPGLINNHGLKISGAYQGKKHAEYSFSSRIRFPRGHTGTLNDWMYAFTSDYMFPLFYPDFNIGRWVYFKKFKMSVFYDHSWLGGVLYNDGMSNSYNYMLQSAGVELTSDIHLLRFIAPIEIGFRTSYLFNNKVDFDFLFSVEFNL
ncbi:MAG: hypothetical protein JW798_07800 [Prolixibacteraceae bacterium]|nr:hypothetical protein [Prolixibacteraceae bacterium]